MSPKDLLNCYTDLNRSAVSLYLNPQGQNHLIFLNHAIKIIKINKYKNQLIKIQKQLHQKLSKKEISYLADQILALLPEPPETLDEGEIKSIIIDIAKKEYIKEYIPLLDL